MTYKERSQNCMNCGQIFTKRMSPSQIFCSVSCRQAYRNDPSRNPSKRPQARWKISLSRKGKPTTLGLPCSEEKKHKISAALKGKPTGRRPSQKSIEAFVKAGAKNLCRRSGSDHPLWQGGLAKARQARYKEPEYLQWVKTCLSRDDYTCQSCGTRNGMGRNVVLHVHHKIHYWERPDLAYDLNNGITLCKPCHFRSHKGMKKPMVGVIHE